jgi:NADPH2:quinone reductase
MHAIRVHETGGPDVLRLETIPDPEPGPGEVLVRVHAIGVNPVETYRRAGMFGHAPELPYTPGSDAAGVVEAVGPGVRSVSVGERVYTSGSKSGTYAELALSDAADVHPLPEKVSFEAGAALGVPYATAYRALVQRGGARSGEMLLVHGATGGVGLAAVQIAVSRGVRVVGTGGTEEGRRLVEAEGAERAFDHHAEGYLEQVREWSGGRGVDLILEMLANVNLGRDLPLLAPRGRVVVVGSRGPVEITPRDLMMRDADIRGMMLGHASPEELAEIHAALFAGLTDGSLRPVVGKRFALHDAPRAHEAVMHPGAHGKVVLLP